MSTEAQFATFTIPDSRKKSAGKNIFARYLFHWPLYLIAFALAAAGANYLLKKERPVYSIRAVVAIKETEEQKKQPVNPQQGKSVEDQIEVLRSLKLVRKVVDDLGLNITYQKKRNGSYVDIYGETPLRMVSVPPGDSTKIVLPFNGSLELTVKGRNSYAWSQPDGTTKQLTPATILKSPSGSWQLNPLPGIEQNADSVIRITVENPERTAMNYQKSVNAQQTDKMSTTVALSTSDENPQRGKDILNSMIRNYNSVDVLQKQEESQNTIKFLDKRLEELTTEIKTLENQMGGLQIPVSSPVDPNINRDNIRNNDNRMNEINIQLSIVDNIQQYINSTDNSGKVPSTIGISDPSLISSIEKLSQVQLQRERLLATLPETNPDFEPIDRQIQILRSSIRDNVRNIRSALLKTKDKLQSLNSGLESSIRNVPSEGREYTNLKNQKNIKETLYNTLMQKREETMAAYTSIVDSAPVVDMAYAEKQKSKKSAILGAALMLGLVLPTGFVFLRDKISGRITDAEEIRAVLKVPVLAELPYEKLSGRAKATQSRSMAVIEQFRTLRTKLYYIHEEKGRKSGRVTLLTSSIPEEGKSFVSSNLGYAIASAERKTVILEMDLRRPKITENFLLDKERKGITDYLRGKAEIDEIIQSSVLIPELDIIGSGKDVHNPSELLEKKQLAELIGYLREHYDDIIIDSPPLHLVSDALILAKLSDVTLYMVRQGYTKKSELKYIRELQEEDQLNALHIIFNGIQRVKYGYGYDYNNAYYDRGKKHASGFVHAVFSDFFQRF